MKKMKYLRMLILMVGFGISVPAVSASNLNSDRIYPQNTLQRPTTVVNQEKNKSKTGNERLLERKNVSNKNVFLPSKNMRNKTPLINQEKKKIFNESLPETKNMNNNKGVLSSSKNTQRKSMATNYLNENTNTKYGNFRVFNKSKIADLNLNSGRLYPQNTLQRPITVKLKKSDKFFGNNNKPFTTVNQRKNKNKTVNERLLEGKNASNKNVFLPSKNMRKKTPLFDKDNKKVLNKALPNTKDTTNGQQLKKQKENQKFKGIRLVMSVNSQNKQPKSDINKKIINEYKSKYPSYPSAKYYELCQKSKFFKSVKEKLFDEKYDEEYNDYNYMHTDEGLIISNVRNNLYKKNESFKFLTGLEEKQKKNTLSDLEKSFLAKIQNKKVKDNVENIIKNFNFSLEDTTNSRVKPSDLVEVFDPQYKIIKFPKSFLPSIYLYCYEGRIKGYRNLINGKYYTVDSKEYIPDFSTYLYKNGIEKADSSNGYRVFVSENNEIKYLIGDKIFDVTNEDGKIWYSLNGNKKFFSVQGRVGYVDLNRNTNLMLNIAQSLNDISFNDNKLPEKYFDNTKDKGEYAEDPQYEVVNLNGDTMYFFEGLPRYVKLKKGYYNIKNNKIYPNLPIVNADYYWDKEYEVIKRDDKLFYYVDAKPVYEVTQTQIPNSNETLLTYSPVLKNNPNGKLFTSIKGQRGYRVNVFSFNGDNYIYYKKLPFLG